MFHDVAVVGDHVERDSVIRDVRTGQTLYFAAGAVDLFHKGNPKVP